MMKQLLTQQPLQSRSYFRPSYRVHFFTLSLLFSGLGDTASASIQLDRAITYFDADKLPRQDILVTNPDKERLFLETEVFKVNFPGASNEERIKITDPDKVQLLATPDKSIVPPGGRKTVRLVHLDKPPTIEEVYRVTFQPVVGESETKESAVKILVAYQVLVFIRPKHPFVNVAGKAKDREITFTNKGNINVVLRNGRYCPAGVSQKASRRRKQQHCKDISESNRIYAGGSWTLEIPPYAKPKKGFIEFGLFDGKKERSRQFAL